MNRLAITAPNTMKRIIVLQILQSPQYVSTSVETGTFRVAMVVLCKHHSKQDESYKKPLQFASKSKSGWLSNARTVRNMVLALHTGAVFPSGDLN